MSLGSEWRAVGTPALEDLPFAGRALEAAIQLEVKFTDMNGRTWHRFEHVLLKRLCG